MRSEGEESASCCLIRPCLSQELWSVICGLQDVSHNNALFFNGLWPVDFHTTPKWLLSHFTHHWKIVPLKSGALSVESGWLTKIHLLPLSQGSSKKDWVYLTPLLKHVDSKTKNGVITSLNCNKGTSIQSQRLHVTSGTETLNSQRHRKLQFCSFMWCFEKLVHFSHIITTKILTNNSETKI